MFTHHEATTIDSVLFAARITTFLLTAPLPSLRLSNQDPVNINISELSRTPIQSSTILTCRNILEKLTWFYACTKSRDPNPHFATLNIAHVLLHRLRTRCWRHFSVTSYNTDEFPPSIWLAAAVIVAHKFEEDYSEPDVAFWAESWNINRRSLMRAERALLHNIAWNVWVKVADLEDFERWSGLLRWILEMKERENGTGVQVEKERERKVEKFRSRGDDMTFSDGDEK
jgi:hypothetical protein